MSVSNIINEFSLEVKRNLEYKDEVLNYIADSFNVAQFISFTPYELIPRYSRIFGLSPNEKCETIEETLELLINNSQEKSINIRTFKQGVSKGNPFYYGITNVIEAHDLLTKLANEGYYTIVNETIDIHDGGISGVVMNDVIEFSPNDTPKCVEKPGFCSLPRELGIRILNSVYGFMPNLNFSNELRVEFSIHPKRRGFQKTHTIIWEVEDGHNYTTDVEISWPNNFSRFIGDKAFGLLIADAFGVNVPKATLISRNVRPFVFGKETGISEIWIRTCPQEKTPGKFPTYFGWRDPFDLMSNNELEQVVSILSQHSVDAIYSGAALPSRNDLIIEGVEDFGDDFMLGKASPIDIPINVKSMIHEIYSLLKEQLGEVNFEWVFDGTNVWIVQLSKSSIISTSKIIYPGKVNKYIQFFVDNGLESLRELLKSIDNQTGVELIGNIGITSHFGDILRNAQVPSKLKRI